VRENKKVSRNLLQPEKLTFSTRVNALGEFGRGEGKENGRPWENKISHKESPSWRRGDRGKNHAPRDKRHRAQEKQSGPFR